jgi:hypothetical protein
MWVAPVETVKKIYGTALIFAFPGLNPDLSPESRLKPGQGIKTSGYISSLKWRTTPVEWLGVSLAILGLFLGGKFKMSSIKKRTTVYVIVFGFLYFLMMSIASGLQTSHYVMTVQVCISFVAGIAFVYLYDKARELGWFSRYQFIPGIVLSAVLVVQILGTFQYYPYYFTYNNPIMLQLNQGQATGYGYGIGLDQAASYLSQKPEADRLTVMSFYSQSLAYLFPGKTFHIRPHPRWSEIEIAKLRKSDYLVIYVIQQKARNIPEKLMNDLDEVQPEHIILIDNVEYVRIYKVSDLPDRVFQPDED